MTLFDVTLPSLGDDDDAVKGGKLSLWCVAPGDQIAEGDDLLELTTDKAAFVLPSPKSGIVREQRFAEGDALKVGDVVCTISVAD